MRVKTVRHDISKHTQRFQPQRRRRKRFTHRRARGCKFPNITHHNLMMLNAGTRSPCGSSSATARKNNRSKAKDQKRTTSRRRSSSPSPFEAFRFTLESFPSSDQHSPTSFQTALTRASNRSATSLQTAPARSDPSHQPTFHDNRRINFDAEFTRPQKLRFKRPKRNFPWHQFPTLRKHVVSGSRPERSPVSKLVTSPSAPVTVPLYRRILTTGPFTPCDHSIFQAALQPISRRP